jgi:hypothetical protein
MAERLSRNELYDLVWSEPMTTLSSRFGISDVALKKTCKRAEIPTPDRGYWAKKEAGKETFQAALPLRPPAMDDEILVAGGNNYYWHSESKEEELQAPLPTPPEFSEPIEAVRKRIAKAIGEIKVPHQVRVWHPAIDRFLKEDEERRQKQLAGAYSYSWNKPQLDASFERRRLRILNTLFFATEKMNGKPSISFREGLDIGISFHQRYVHLALDQPKQPNRRNRLPVVQPEPSETRLALSIRCGPCSETDRMTWQDNDEGKLETRMAEIAVEVILTAEIQYREMAVQHYQLCVKRRAQLEEEERQRKLAIERAEQERLRRVEQARIDRLLGDAAAFQQAAEIRKYVETIRLTQACDGFSVTGEFERWSQWALAQADRIDPAHGGAFLKAMHDEDEVKK